MKMPSKAIIYGITILSLIIIIGGTASWIVANSGSSPAEPLPSLNPDEEYFENSDDISPTDNAYQNNEPPAESSTG